MPSPFSPTSHRSPREHPALPDGSVWARAHRDWEKLLLKEWIVETSRGDVCVTETQTFMECRQTARLTEAQRRSVQTVMVQVGRGAVHPATNPQPIDAEPEGAFMCSPAPGVTLTWRKRHDKPQLNVLLTLENDRPAQVGNPLV